MPIDTKHQTWLTVNDETRFDLTTEGGRALAYVNDGNGYVMSTVGSRLRLARERHGWTQEHLGKLSGVSQSGINKIEQDGTRKPRKLDALASALGVAEEWLQYGSNPPSWAAKEQTHAEQLDRLFVISTPRSGAAITALKDRLASGSLSEDDAKQLLQLADYLISRDKGQK